MITKRQQEILKFIVEEYVKTVKPVSSSEICKSLKCSSATIRNEMVILEDLGYLEKNHYGFIGSPKVEVVNGTLGYDSGKIGAACLILFK